MASNETIRRMAQLSNVLIAEDICPSIRLIGVIFGSGFPHRGADYFLRKIGIRSQLVIQGRVLTGGFDAVGLKAWFGGVVGMSMIIGIVMGLGLGLGIGIGIVIGIGLEMDMDMGMGMGINGSSVGEWVVRGAGL